MKHKLTNHRTLRSGRPVADCSVCGQVGVLTVPGLGGKQRLVCERSARLQAKMARQTERKRAASKEKRTKKRYADELAYRWRRIVFERAGRKCEVCDKPAEVGSFMLQAHHLIKRRASKRLVLDPLNGMALCPGHHQYADRDPAWALAFVEAIRPGTTLYLLEQRRLTAPVPVEDIERMLARCEAALGLCAPQEVQR